jgi:hypothetical protein
MNSSNWGNLTLRVTTRIQRSRSKPMTSSWLPKDGLDVLLSTTLGSDLSQRVP